MGLFIWPKSPVKRNFRGCAVVAHADFDDRRAEDMPGVVEDGRHVVVDLDFLVVGRRLQLADRAIDVLHGIERLDGIFALPAFLAMPLLLERGVFRLNLGRVAEHQFDQIGRGGGGENRPAIAFLHQFRHQPAMIDVRVGEQHDVEFRRPDRARRPIAGQEFPFLKHAAIDQQPHAVGFEKVLRTGNLPRRPQKLQLHVVSRGWVGLRWPRSRIARKLFCPGILHLPGISFQGFALI